MKRFIISLVFIFLLLVGRSSAEEVFSYQPDPFLSKMPASTDAGAAMVRQVNIHYVDAEQVKLALSNCYPWLKVVNSKDQRSIVIKGSEKYLKKAEELIKELDRKPSQILIEAKIIEISESGLQQLGVLWDVTQAGIKFGSNVQPDLDGLIKTLEGKGLAKIKARPTITTVEGQEAFVRIGDRIPYALPVGTSATDMRWNINYLDAGIILQITPRHTVSGNILMDLHPQVINLKEWKPTAAGDFPILSSREAKTQVEVQSGASFAIAGLQNEEQKENLTKIPLLGDLPLLGELFTFRTKENVKTEVVFIITPTLLAQ